MRNNIIRKIDTICKKQPDQDKKGGALSCHALQQTQLLLADKLDTLARAFAEKAEGRKAHPKLASYSDEANEILHQSARYVRDFDYEKTQTKVWEYIRRYPGQSFIIAGSMGFLLGVVLWHR